MDSVVAGVGGWVKQLRKRFHTLLWDAESPGPLGTVFRVVALTLWKFNGVDKGFLRASALTYSTLLSLVPLLALMFSVLKGFGVQRRLEPLLLERLAIGNQEVVRQIIEYVDNTKIGALGAFGLVALLFTAVSVLGNIEMSFNDIWQVRRGRNLLRKVADYIAMLVVGPVLLLASLSMGTLLQTSGAAANLALLGPVQNLLLRAAPYASIWAALALVYMLMPNRRVPLGSAVLGGVVAGTLWKVAEGLYIQFQFGMAKYNAIYGAMAQLPMLLVWVYLSWCLVLLGAELAFVCQLPGKGRFLKARGGLWVPRLDVALGMLLVVARRFERGQAAPSVSDVVTEVGLHPGQADGIVSRLVQDGLLTWTQDEPPCLLPARSPDRTPVAELIHRVGRLAEVDPQGEGACLELAATLEREYSGRTWADLALAGAPQP
ncbi:MAG TPA: YihY/virulence factor BrkB family protein [Deferrisomatales bacterium]|nr:YihY/virulence factor BrkB family protein [Deferrisomatales bacterium]